jgi:hypothetical protein
MYNGINIFKITSADMRRVSWGKPKVWQPPAQVAQLFNLIRQAGGLAMGLC